MIHVLSVVFADSVGESVEEFNIGEVLSESELREVSWAKMILFGGINEL
jgi:hypothetical protein